MGIRLTCLTCLSYSLASVFVEWLRLLAPLHGNECLCVMSGVEREQDVDICIEPLPHNTNSIKRLE